MINNKKENNKIFNEYIYLLTIEYNLLKCIDKIDNIYFYKNTYKYLNKISLLQDKYDHKLNYFILNEKQKNKLNDIKNNIIYLLCK